MMDSRTDHEFGALTPTSEVVPAAEPATHAEHNNATRIAAIRRLMADSWPAPDFETGPARRPRLADRWHSFGSSSNWWDTMTSGPGRRPDRHRKRPRRCRVLPVPRRAG